MRRSLSSIVSWCVHLRHLVRPIKKRGSATFNFHQLPSHVLFKIALHLSEESTPDEHVFNLLPLRLVHRNVTEPISRSILHYCVIQEVDPDGPFHHCGRELTYNTFIKFVQLGHFKKAIKKVGIRISRQNRAAEDVEEDRRRCLNILHVISETVQILTLNGGSPLWIAPSSIITAFPYRFPNLLLLQIDTSHLPLLLPLVQAASSSLKILRIFGAPHYADLYNFLHPRLLVADDLIPGPLRPALEVVAVSKATDVRMQVILAKLPFHAKKVLLESEPWGDEVEHLVEGAKVWPVVARADAVHLRFPNSEPERLEVTRQAILRCGHDIQWYERGVQWTTFCWKSSTRSPV